MKCSSVLRFLLLLILVLSINGCTESYRSWDGISTISYNEIQYDPQTNVLWASNFLDSKLSRLDLATGKQEEILLPADIRVSYICFSHDLWFAGFNQISRRDVIGSYTSNGFMMFNHESILLGCRVMADGEILFWEKNIVTNLDLMNKLQAIQGVGGYAIIDAFRAEDNSLWILTEDGDIYTSSKSGEWTFFAKSRVYKGLYVDKSHLWITSDNGIFRYQLSDQSAPENLLKTSLGVSQDIFEARNGSIWVVTSENIWVWRDDKFEMINLPFGMRLIKDYAVDFENNILYVSLDGGIYSLKMNE